MPIETLRQHGKTATPEQSRQLHQALGLIAAAGQPQDGFPSGDQAAAILLSLRTDHETLLAALLSDRRLEKTLSPQDMASNFGAKTAALVKDVRWLNAQAIYRPELGKLPRQSELIRRMLLATTHDARAVLIKLAYQIGRLRKLSSAPEAARPLIAQETLAIYAPLAGRLGVSQFKWELEDLAFRALQPETYRQIAHGLMENRVRREARVERFIHKLRALLKNHGIEGEVKGRPKHIYSIWNKMQRKQLTLAQLYDLLAVRVIVKTVNECYWVLGLVHNQWQTVPKEFDDYIAGPKENGYQSLHTVIISDTGERLEIQIRTQAMHEFAELGVAAHWRYKEGGRHQAASEKAIASLRRLLAHEANGDELARAFQTELFSDRVYVLTPQGQIIDLIKGATALDFAYAIHTDIGHACQGAKINGALKPLTTVLQTGDSVEILTRNMPKPNRNWLDPSLGYLKTPKAQNKVRAWFKQQDRSQHMTEGKALLDKTCRRLKLTDWSWPTILARLRYPDKESLWAALGTGQLTIEQILSAFPQPDPKPRSNKPPSAGNSPLSVTVAGIAGVKTTLAKCCLPEPNAPIAAYVTVRKGIVIHRQDCPALTRLSKTRLKQLLPALWQTESPSAGK